MFYILAPTKEPRPVSLREWCVWRGRAAANGDHVVAFTELPAVEVSTIFLGWGMALKGPPLVFESMVFAAGSRSTVLDERRYATWIDAEVGHAELVEKYARLPRF